MDQGAIAVGQLATRRDQADGGEDDMVAAAEVREHLPRLRAARRLPQRPIVQGHHGVGSQNRALRWDPGAFGDVPRLAESVGEGQRLRIIRARRLGEPGCHRAERDAKSGQQAAPLRRAGSQDDQRV